MRVSTIARERRHTFYFLDEIRRAAPVFLDTEIDMSGVYAHRAAARAEGRRLSLVTYVLHSGAAVLAAHPEANAAIRGRLRPRVARYPGVHGKLTLDRRLNGTRVVLATVVPDADRADLDAVQAVVDRFRDGDPHVMPEFAGVRLLHKLPAPVARLAYRKTVRPLRARPEFFGTFAVTSLGHRPVDGFHSVGGTTVTLGVGRVLERPVVRDGSIVAAPVMRLSLAFDHRVIDGAEAADVLGEIKDRMEAYAAAGDARPDGHAAGSSEQPPADGPVGGRRVAAR